MTPSSYNIIYYLFPTLSQYRQMVKPYVVVILLLVTWISTIILGVFLTIGESSSQDLPCSMANVFPRVTMIILAGPTFVLDVGVLILSLIVYRILLKKTERKKKTKVVMPANLNNGEVTISTRLDDNVEGIEGQLENRGHQDVNSKNDDKSGKVETRGKIKVETRLGLGQSEPRKRPQISAMDARLRWQTISLITISLWSFLFHLPIVMFMFYQAFYVKDRTTIHMSSLGYAFTSMMTLNVLGDPFIYAWRFIKWKDMFRRMKRRIFGRN